MDGLVYVDTYDSLKEACTSISSHPVIGIDIECENNLHHYGEIVAIIQISTPDKNYIIDTIALKDISCIVSIFEDKNVQKIFHDVTFDLEMLKFQFKCRPKNIFDTQIAALLLGKKDIGLNALLHEYFDFHNEKKFQMADWTKRPLPKEMLYYAMSDTRYLIRLRQHLINELMEKHRLDWAAEEFLMIEKREFPHKRQGFMDVKGIQVMNDSQRAVLKRLFTLREKLAKKVDRPVHFIMSTKLLVDISRGPQKSIEWWQNVKGVHPVVRRYSNAFFEEVKAGMKERVPLPPVVKKRFSIQQQKKMQWLSDKRDKIAETLGIQAHLLMNKDQMKDIVINNNTRSLKNWQRNILKL